MTLLLSAATTATTTAATSAASAISTAKPVSATSLMFQLLLGLAVVLGVIWVGARLMRGRFGAAPGRRRPAHMEVIGRQTLGKGMQLAVVRAGADTWLLGVTGHQITRLGRYRPEEIEVLESPDDLPGASPAHQSPFTLAPTARLQATIRQMQERTLRRS